MDINNGRITPTSKIEEKTYSRFLREQYEASYKHEQAPRAEKDIELSNYESHMLLCGIERACKEGVRLHKYEARVVNGTIRQLAHDFINASQEAIESYDVSQRPQHPIAHEVIGMAFRQSTLPGIDRYSD